MIGGGEVRLKPSMYINSVLLVDGLKHNLPSICQLCDSGNNVTFDKHKCTIYQHNGIKMFVATRQENLYKINIYELSDKKVSCLMFYGIGNVAIRV